MNKTRPTTILLAALSLTLMVGCASAPKPLPEKTFPVSYRKFAAEPVYNRVRYGHLPEVLPNGYSDTTKHAPLLLPVASLELKDATLEEASKALAQFGNYSSYCSSFIANRPISITRVGTLDELGQAISELAHIKVVIDHNNRSISFLGSRPMSVGLSEGLSEGTVEDEHRSHY